MVLGRLDMQHVKNRNHLFLAAAFMLSLSSAANGSNDTQIDFLGYSSQGRYFAYEEFGVSESPKVAFSQIYVVDLTQNTWVVGTPVRFEAFLSERSLMSVRGQLRANVRILLDGLEIDTPAVITALIGEGAPDKDAQELVFNVPAQSTSKIGGTDFLLNLSTFETSSAFSCKETFGQEPIGVSLALETRGDRLVLYEDAALPFSRGCPQEYAMKGVVMPFGASDISNAVAIVSVITREEDVLERHFLVIPIAYDIQGLR